MTSQNTDKAEDNAFDFFRVMHQQFENTITEHSHSEKMLFTLLTQAFSAYEANADLQSQGQPEPACQKGCATCCTIRVVATAPEIFLVARYIRAMEQDLKQQGIDISQRLADSDEITRGRSEAERVDLHRRCPYIHKGVCVIYAVRPLACRSHISYSLQACVDAAAGKLDEIPYSEPHMNVRSLVQNAMQSALRDADYPWATYELNHALSIALSDEQAEQKWLSSNDVFAPAVVKDVSLEEMGATFDQIHARGF